ncbi:CHAD domain-containing protein [Sandarakinorhabdus sp. AAP62]|uniref:CHAD domain-containing protein n=1 Tax=Sandarakinorhabdus sp. AAP62 TaxID=1248916 RepID=UPI0003185089|nr:CHAD domain-containing protein [Sandarakinorhabdus sp. AAP62]
MGRDREGLLDLGGNDAVWRAVLGSCLGQYRRNEAQLLAAPIGESLHQTRVSLRRLRSALRLFEPLTGPQPALTAGLRDLSGALGAVRDLDVLLARAKPGLLHDRLSAARDEAFVEAMAVLRAAPTRAMLRDLSEWLVLHPPLPAGAARVHAARQLERCRRKVKKAGRALVAGDDAARHQLRKRVKRLRHASELLGSLFPAASRQARFMAALLPLQDVLGVLNDLAVAQAVLARIGGSRARGAAALIGMAQRTALLLKAGKAHEQVMAAPRFWR